MCEDATCDVFEDRRKLLSFLVYFILSVDIYVVEGIEAIRVFVAVAPQDLLICYCM